MSLYRYKTKYEGILSSGREVKMKIVSRRIAQSIKSAKLPLHQEGSLEPPIEETVNLIIKFGMGSGQTEAIKNAVGGTLYIEKKLLDFWRVGKSSAMVELNLYVYVLPEFQTFWKLKNPEIAGLHNAGFQQGSLSMFASGRRAGKTLYDSY